MTGALIILAAIVVVGVILRLLHKPEPEAPAATDPAAEAKAAEGEECCGMHISCEKDSLSPGVGEQPEYYDDEELDAFAGRPADSYTDAEAEAFREVLLTLRPEEIAGWYRAISLRGIELPVDVRDELIMIVSEARAAQTGAKQ